MTTALITGVSGQDGWFLARRLLEFGYSVIGTTHRRGASGKFNVRGQKIPVVELDLGDFAQIENLVRRERPDELYNLAARASSAQLFDDPLATADINGAAVARILEAIRRHSPATRLCQASSAEVFIGAPVSPQDEATPRMPLNAYGAAKAFADHLIASYRARGLFACSAVLYPHESERRSPHFLVRKVTQAAAQIAAGKASRVVIGDLGAIRDWSYAPDTVEAMRLMLRQAEPRDYVIATGEPHTVGEVCEVAFAHVGLDWRRHVTVDEELVRAPDRVPRVGNPARAKAELAWAPTLRFAGLINHLVASERVLLGVQ
jgi:GDPmannose 4,6-dehydratase